MASVKPWYHELIDDKFQWHDLINPVGLGAYVVQNLPKAFNNIGGMFTGENQAANQELERQAAQTAMEFEQSSAEKAMQFEADQAQIERDYYERLRSTAHQVEVEDLKAAGLNPILSANAGAASSATGVASGFSAQGHRAEVDTYNQTLGLLSGLSGILNSAASLAHGKSYSKWVDYKTSG